MRIVVTGATGGIGRTLVPLLAARGVDVVATGRDATIGRSLAGSGVHGYATIVQLPNGTFKVTQYSAATGQPVSHYTLTP